MYCKRGFHLSQIVTDECSFKVLSTKVEIKLKKRDGIRWPKLEGDGQPPVPTAASLATSVASDSNHPPSYISSSGRNWSKISTVSFRVCIFRQGLGYFEVLVIIFGHHGWNNYDGDNSNVSISEGIVSAFLIYKTYTSFWCFVPNVA
jgi:hypothetical protein